jgi:hypothetical protein
MLRLWRKIDAKLMSGQRAIGEKPLKIRIQVSNPVNRNYNNQQMAYNVKATMQFLTNYFINKN